MGCIFASHQCWQESLDKILVTMFSKSCAILLLSDAACSALNTEDVSLYEDQSDPRVFFANYTSSLLAVNTTILAYAGIIRPAFAHQHTIKDCTRHKCSGDNVH